MVVVGNLIVSLFIVPATLVLLARGKTGGAREKVSIAGALLGASRQPLVFLPVAGVLVALLGIPVPKIAADAADEIGRAAGGVALFLLGLILSGIRFRLDTEVVLNALVKNVLQPAVILAVGHAAGLRGPALAQVFLLGVLPTATEVSAISAARGVYAEEAAAATLLSTLGAVVSIGVGMGVTAALR